MELPVSVLSENRRRFPHALMRRSVQWILRPWKWKDQDIAKLSDRALKDIGLYTDHPRVLGRRLPDRRFDRF